MMPQHLQDWHEQTLTPVRFWARTVLDFLNASFAVFYPENPLVHFLEDVANGKSLSGGSAFDVRSTKFRGVPVAVEEKRMGRHPFFDIVHFKRKAENAAIQERMDCDPKVLFVPPFSGHFASLFRDTIETLLPAHDLFIIDWKDAKTVSFAHGSFGLEEQISALSDALRALGADVHVIAAFQSSFSALAAVALLAGRSPDAQPLSLTLIAGPIDAERGFVEFREIAKMHTLAWLEERYVRCAPFHCPGAYRQVCNGFLQMHPRLSSVLQGSCAETMKCFEHLVRGDEETPRARERLYKEFLSLMDVPAELYLQFIDHAYLKCSLASGMMTCKARAVDPGAITATALLTIEGELDDLSPPGQTRAAHELCSSLPAGMKEDHLEIGVGHYGLFSGKKWRNTIAPVIHKFIRKHAMRP